ncbi:phosphatase PAP2 family protein [Methyloceanibacter sp.]|jgi:undecaprenyl-diphosphatase|uniref:phosphatase PAP2 family protein n=1 Tax=Methyloceanibacter sp. TaxID=1965321 RepID=UPI00351BC77E
MRFYRPEIWTLVAIFAIAGLVLAFGHIAEEALEGDATKFDQTILLFFRNAGDIGDPIGPPWMEEAARDVTALGSYAVLSIVTCAVVVYLFMAGQRTAALWLLGAVVSGVLLSNLLKLTFERPRPDLVPHAVRVFTSGFPSGHATLSAITYLTLGALLASLHSSIRFKAYFLGLAISLTLAVGISRIYLGVHYPTDVLAGWCIGAAWAAFCWTVFRELQRHGQIGPPVKP